jgi:hypothetical protein
LAPLRYVRFGWWLLGDLLVFQVKRVLGVIVAGVSVVSLAACGNRGTGDAAPTSTPATSAPPADPTTSTTLDPAVEVERAYLAFEDMFTRLRENPDPDDPEIGQRTTGKAKNDIVNSQTTAKTFGERAEFGPRDSVDVIDVDLAWDTAVLRSCAVEDITITNTGGGQIGPRLTTYWTSYTLSRAGDGWVVSSWEAIKKEDGERPCDA